MGFWHREWGSLNGHRSEKMRGSSHQKHFLIESCQHCARLKALSSSISQCLRCFLPFISNEGRIRLAQPALTYLYSNSHPMSLCSYPDCSHFFTLFSGTTNDSFDPPAVGSNPDVSSTGVSLLVSSCNVFYNALKSLHPLEVGHDCVP